MSTSRLAARRAGQTAASTPTTPVVDQDDHDQRPGDPQECDPVVDEQPLQGDAEEQAEDHAR